MTKHLYWYKKADEDNESAEIGDMLYAMTQYYGVNKYSLLLEAANYNNANALKDLSCLVALSDLGDAGDQQALQLYRRYAELSDDTIKQEDVTMANVYYAVYDDYYHYLYYYGDDYDEENSNIEPQDTWLKKAAELGLAQAQHVIGRQYYDNEEYAQAVTWYRKVAEQGHSDAQLDLAIAMTKVKVWNKTTSKPLNGISRLPSKTITWRNIGWPSTTQPARA